MALDARIRFAGVVEKSGHLYAGVRREDAPNKLSGRNSEVSLSQSAYIVDLRKMFAQDLGELRSVVYNYDKVNLISLPVKDHILVVSAEVDVKPDELAGKLRNYLKSIEAELKLYPPSNVVTQEKREAMRNLLESGISDELVAEQLDLDVELVRTLTKELTTQ